MANKAAPTLGEFMVALSHRRLSFRANETAQARETEVGQKRLWRSLITSFRPAAANLEGNLNRLADTVDRVIDESPIQSQPDPVGGVELSCHFPMLLADEIAGFQQLLNQRPWPSLAAVFIALQFPIWSSRAAHRSEHLDQILSDPRMQTALFAAQIELLEENPLKRLSQNLVDDAERMEELLKDASSVRTSLFNAEAERAGRFETFLQQASDDIEAARKQATEAGILLSATHLWARKAILHGVGFWLGLAAMAGIVGTGLYMAYLHGPAFLASLPKKADGEVTYVTVALITICAIAAGWLLRFIGRFVTESMVLQTDADQRRVMLQTYLALVGDKDAKMEQADRTLILNAVFRPLPGHQSEDVALPTLLDLARSAVPGGDKK